LTPPAPNGVRGLTGRQRAGRKLRLTWFYSPLDQETAPREFHVCWDATTGWIDWEHPLATIPYDGPRRYQYETGPLDQGRYTFVVRPGAGDPVEAASRASLVCSITGSSPAAPTILGPEAV
jgi:hypothetical protein